MVDSLVKLCLESDGIKDEEGRRICVSPVGIPLLLHHNGDLVKKIMEKCPETADSYLLGEIYVPDVDNKKIVSAIQYYQIQRDVFSKPLYR